MKLYIRVGENFKPSPKLKSLYYTYLFLTLVLGILSWYIPVLIFAPIEVSVGIFIPLMAILAFIIYWIPKYYESITYTLTENEIIWKRGVWFKNMGIVPYNRITNIDIAQGPISRKYGIASLSIQTAGYSAASTGKLAEIKILGIEDFEELRNMILEFVKGKRPVAVETYEEDINLKILKELTRIRELLEKTLK
ncbi:MAG: PH domain-containing protein [Nitrososphaeria archaeon]|nr:PH domain-containing protein [Nitrososphaeria archaeon]